MEDQKNAETNSADGGDLNEDENLSGDQYEITVEDIDSAELDFDIIDFDVVDNDEDEIENGFPKKFSSVHLASNIILYSDLL